MAKGSEKAPWQQHVLEVHALASNQQVCHESSNRYPDYGWAYCIFCTKDVKPLVCPSKDKNKVARENQDLLDVSLNLTQVDAELLMLNSQSG